MAIQILRFEQGAQVKKNTSSVTLTPVIQLDGTSWNITGIVNHTGSLNQGHYTAYICQQQHHGSDVMTPEWPRRRQRQFLVLVQSQHTSFF